MLQGLRPVDLPLEDRLPKKINAKKLLSTLSRETPLPLVFIFAPDRVRRERGVLHLVKKWHGSTLARSYSQNDCLSRIDAQNFNSKSFSELKDKLTSLTLFSQKNIFVIENADCLKADLAKKLITIFETVSDSINVFVTGNKPGANSPLLKFARTTAACLEFDSMSEDDLSKWAKRELAQAGFPELEGSTIPCLLEIGNHDPDQVSAAIEQLSLYLDVDRSHPLQRPLERKDILELFLFHPDPVEFELVDKLTAGRRADAEVLLRSLLSAGKNEFLLLSLIARSFSQFLIVNRLARIGRGEAQIREALKLPPWLAKKVISAAKRYSGQQLQAAHGAIVAADGKLKGKSLGAEAVFSDLFDRLAA